MMGWCRWCACKISGIGVYAGPLAVNGVENGVEGDRVLFFNGQPLRLCCLLNQ